MDYYTLCSSSSINFVSKRCKYRAAKKPKFKESIITSVKSKSIIILVISFALINEVVQVVGVFLNQAQYIRSGINMKYFGILVVVMQIVQLSSIKAYRLSNRLGKNKSIQILYGLITISCITLVFTTNAIVSIISIFCIYGSSSLINHMVLEIQNKSIKTINRATLLSIFAMFGSLAGAGVNIIIGKTADISISVAFATCVVICICASLLFGVYKRINLKEVNIDIESKLNF